MSPTAETLFQSALGLPADEQIELAEAILASWAENQSRPFDEAWLTEIRRRSQQIVAGTAKTAPWHAVQERVRQRLEERHGG